MNEGVRCPFCGVWLPAPERHECGRDGWHVVFRKEARRR